MTTGNQPPNYGATPEMLDKIRDADAGTNRRRVRERRVRDNLPELEMRITACEVALGLRTA